MKKIVLAYSGGLDTSVAIKWLTERDYEVVAYLADVGQGQDFNVVKERALKTGAVKVIIDDLKREFVSDFIFPALKANAVYEGKYFLATALSRPVIAKGLVRAAEKEKAAYIGHGCTGKGNDQVRFEVTAMILNPKLKVVAPVREWDLPTRDAEIEYAKLHDIPIDVTKKKPYSIDKNVWGISIESGKLEDPYFEPPEDIYQMSTSVDKSPKKAAYVEIYFEKGIPKKINGLTYAPLKLVEALNVLGGKHGIGRTDMIEDRLVGIKSREIYEAPAAVILSEAHKALELLTLDRETIHFKEKVTLEYSRLVYFGLWYSPLKTALDRFIDTTQKRVTGTVRVRCHKGHAVVVGRKSPHSLYRETLATYGEGDTFDQSLAKGFIQIFGLPYRK
ncbi:MAG: argininosuccinate synthase [Candidatus Omnitrophica bacterium]|nr:argininosuccinate synthase [Candidatus Omnitrophota bacterium]